MDQELPAFSPATLLDNFYDGLLALVRGACDLFGAAVHESDFFCYFGDFASLGLDVVEYFAFDELQIKLLKGFVFVLICNTILILFTWKIYGKRISNRFMRTATSKTIEDLKKSASMLKLPKEHNPRV